MRAILAIVCAAALAGSTLQATTVLPTDLRQLTLDAVAIARGQVVALDGHWREDHRGIETLVTLQVDDYLKGALGPTLAFNVPGGRLGRFESVMIGAPTFALGERVVVFLGARGPRVPYVLGLSQGVFVVTSVDGRWMVTPPVIPLAKVSTAIVRGDLSRRPLPLADFEQQVRIFAGGLQ